MLYGSDVLRNKAVDVDIKDAEELKEFIKNMWDTLDNAEGVGLAAPQVGRSIRLVIVDGTPLAEDLDYLKDFKRTIINPEVVEESEETATYSEGCLSIPDVNANVTRPKTIKVKYLDENFQPQEEVFDEFACRIVQHELDHLEGVMFVDRVAPIRKKMINNKLVSISKGKVGAHYKTKIDRK